MTRVPILEQLGSERFGPLDQIENRIALARQLNSADELWLGTYSEASGLAVQLWPPRNYIASPRLAVG